MSIERTLSIIKPDGVERNLIGSIYQRFEAEGLILLAAKMIDLSQERVEGFYAMHRGKPFFNDLVIYMSSGPVMVQVLEGENAVIAHRELMGATNPKDAAPGTLRAEYAISLDENTVHGSDSLGSAKTEIDYFFTPEEICPRRR